MYVITHTHTLRLADTKVSTSTQDWLQTWECVLSVLDMKKPPLLCFLASAYWESCKETSDKSCRRQVSVCLCSCCLSPYLFFLVCLFVLFCFSLLWFGRVSFQHCKFFFFFFPFPSYISGVHHFLVRFLRMWPFFNPTIKVVTFRLCGWCVLGVFLLPAFTRLGHERQDLLSPCDGMHVCTD